MSTPSSWFRQLLGMTSWVAAAAAGAPAPLRTAWVVSNRLLSPA